MPGGEGTAGIQYRYFTVRVYALLHPAKNQNTTHVNIFILFWMRRCSGGLFPPPPHRSRAAAAAASLGPRPRRPRPDPPLGAFRGGGLPHGLFPIVRHSPRGQRWPAPGPPFPSPYAIPSHHAGNRSTHTIHISVLPPSTSGPLPPPKISPSFEPPTVGQTGGMSYRGGGSPAAVVVSGQPAVCQPCRVWMDARKGGVACISS